MNILKKVWLLGLIQLLLCVLKTAWGGVGDFKMDIRAGVEGNYSLHNRIFFSSDSFTDIPSIIAKRQLKGDGAQFTTLCARGAWLLYPKPHYISAYANLTGISLYAYNSFTCTPLKDLEPLGSAQPITTTQYEKSHITFFPSPNFMGRAMPVGDRIKDDDTYPKATTIINSLITVGLIRWTVLLSDGTRLCIQPKKSETAICFLSNLVDNKKIAPVPTVKKVRRHCLLKNPGLIVEMKECQELQAGLVTTISPTWPLEPPPEEEIPSPPGSEGGGSDTGTSGRKPSTGECKVDLTQDILSEEQKRLLEARLNGTLGTGSWMEGVKNREHIWKTEIFDKALKIYLNVCNREVIDAEYILLFASLYFHYWNNAMLSEGAKDVQFPEADWMEIHSDLDYCFETLKAAPVKSISEFVAQGIKNYRKLSDITDKIKSVLGLRPQYDYVMEINWLMANTVAGVCYAIHNNNVHFVTRFWDTYHPLYFTPIEEQWKDGGNASLVYKYIFGGYGMEKSMAKIGFCALATMVESHLLKPYPRPLEQTKSALLNPK